MVTEFDVYSKFVKARSQSNSKPYNLPKDWVKFYSEKLTKNAQDNLTRSSKYFTTIWCDIDIEKFMECGFELFPKFSYHLFFNRKILELYKRRDKLVKNEELNMKKGIIESVKFIVPFMKGKEYKNLFNDYCKLTIDNRHVIISHYLKNNVSSYFMAWMIAEGYFEVYTNEYEASVPFVIKNYRNLFLKLQNNKSFLNQVKEKF
jgi:hypothetical protein